MQMHSNIYIPALFSGCSSFSFCGMSSGLFEDRKFRSKKFDILCLSKQRTMNAFLLYCLFLSFLRAAEGHQFTSETHRVALLADIVCSKLPSDSFQTQGSWCLSRDEGSSSVLGFNIAPMHLLDVPLAKVIAEIVGRQSSLFDLGAGSGQYKHFMRNHSASIDYRACDGALNVDVFTAGVVDWCDLTKPIRAGPSDWVVSLEVGEHLPAALSEQYLKNLHRLNTKGIILSWAVVGQPGKGHVNCLPNEEVIRRVTSMGYVHDRNASDAGRRVATYDWFKNTFMVFRKT